MTRDSHTKSCKGRAGSKGPFDASFVRTGATRSFGGTLLCNPPRVADVQIALQQALWEHSRMQLHHGKTQFWNRGGEAPRGWRAVTDAARQVDLDAIVWRGDLELPPSEQGVKVLGTPLWPPEYVRAFLQNSTRTHRELLERIPAIPDLQGAWLVLLFCAGRRWIAFLDWGPWFAQCTSSESSRVLAKLG